MEMNDFQTLAEMGNSETKRFITKVARQPILQKCTDHSKVGRESRALKQKLSNNAWQR